MHVCACMHVCVYVMCVSVGERREKSTKLIDYKFSNLNTVTNIILNVVTKLILNIMFFSNFNIKCVELKVRPT